MENRRLAIEIKNHLNKHLGEIVTDVIIFGSRVWGNADETSDYDTIIILKTRYDRKLQKQINDLCYDIDLKYDIFLDTQVISEEELNNSPRGKHPVFRTAIKKGIHA